MSEKRREEVRQVMAEMAALMDEFRAVRDALLAGLRDAGEDIEGETYDPGQPG